MKPSCPSLLLFRALYDERLVVQPSSKSDSKTRTKVSSAKLHNKPCAKGSSTPNLHKLPTLSAALLPPPYHYTIQPHITHKRPHSPDMLLRSRLSSCWWRVSARGANLKFPENFNPQLAHEYLCCLHDKSIIRPTPVLQDI